VGAWPGSAAGCSSTAPTKR